MDAEIGRPGSTAVSTDRRADTRRLSTETKSAYKTTEFLTYVVVFAGILVASFLVKTGQDGQRVDYFRADEAWWYITLLTIGYMVARGLAKSGSREPYDDDRREKTVVSPGHPPGQPRIKTASTAAILATAADR
jgi:hypothetical protein